jgi:hypothetical protein
MLEAPDLKTRAEILIAVTEMDLAKKRTSAIRRCSETAVVIPGRAPARTRNLEVIISGFRVRAPHAPE